MSLKTSALSLLCALFLGSTALKAQPPTPVPTGPGTTSAPGTTITDTTPTLQWSASAGATSYDVYVSIRTGSSYSVIFDSETDWGPAITGTSFTLPSGEISTGNEYRWNMRARNAAGYSGFSTRLYFNLVSPPPSPTAQSPGTSSAPGSTISTTTPTLQWSASSGATEYDVYVSRKVGSSYTLIFDSETDWGPAITGTSFTMPAGEISQGNEYRWNMRAKNSAGYSGFSNTRYFNYPGNPPPSPTAQSPGTGSAPGSTISITTPTLQWSASSGATEYDVYVSQKVGSSYTLIFDSETDWSSAITGTSFTMPAGEISQGNEYRWNMRAKNSAGYSGFSNTLYFNYPGNPPPSPTAQSPGTNSAPGSTISTTTPTLQWSASSGATEYDVYVSQKVGSSYTLIFDSETDWGPAITGTSFTMPAGEISQGNEYRWNMRAKNSAGYSGFSNTLYFNYPGNPPPAPTAQSPGTNSAPGSTISATTPTLQWSASGGATEYDVYVSQKVGSSYTLIFDSESDWGPAITGTSFTMPTGEMSQGNEYRWNMRAKNSAGYSGFSNTLYFTVAGTNPPDTPIPQSPGSASSPGASVGTTTPIMQWTPALGATEYDVYVSQKVGSSYTLIFDSETDWGPAITGTSFTMPAGEISQGNEYRWNMRAKNSTGYSPFSDRLYFHMANSGPPTPPITIGPGSSSAPGAVLTTTMPTLEWQQSLGATEYDVYVSRRVGSSYTLVFDSETQWSPAITGVSFPLPSGLLTVGNEYRWNMRAKNAAGYSGYSTQRYFAIQTQQPPSIPGPQPVGPGECLSPGPVVPYNDQTFSWSASSKGASAEETFSFNLFRFILQKLNQTLNVYETIIDTETPNLNFPVTTQAYPAGSQLRWSVTGIEPDGSHSAPSCRVYMRSEAPACSTEIVNQRFRFPLGLAGQNQGSTKPPFFPEFSFVVDNETGERVPALTYDVDGDGSSEWYVKTPSHTFLNFTNFGMTQLECYSEGDPDHPTTSNALDQTVNCRFCNGPSCCRQFPDYAVYHPGEDWNRKDGNDMGEPVYSIGHGVVVFSGCTSNSTYSNYGYAVAIAHKIPDGGYVTSFYGHLRDMPLVHECDQVTPGQQIGYLGNTIGRGCPAGPSTFGPHLHFEIRASDWITDDDSTLRLACSSNIWPETAGDSIACAPLNAVPSCDGGRSFIANHYKKPYQVLKGIFEDGFHLGDTSLWGATTELGLTSGVRFSDDFNDGSFDPAKWNWSGHTVQEESGELHIDREVTDDGGGADTIPFLVDPAGGTIVVTRRTKVFAANDFFDGSLIFVPGGVESMRFGISYADYQWDHHPECAVHGFALYRNNANSHFCAAQGVDVTNWIPGIWGEWFDERFEYEPTTGSFRYFINGSQQLALNVGVMPQDSSTLQLRLSTWGWHTGHYQHTDDLRVEQMMP